MWKRNSEKTNSKKADEREMGQAHNQSGREHPKKKHAETV
jgi:hypothetical protein